MGKGEETRREILRAALALASEVGLTGLSIGLLAERVGMSKSGLFAHFESKERLQSAVLEEASQRFVELVVSPSLRAPRGLPRVRALFESSLAWERQEFMPGGCIFMTAAVELDDRPGPLREQLVASQRDWLDTLAEAIRIAQREKQIRADVDEHQLAFEMQSLAQGAHFFGRLLRDPQAFARAQKGLERLLADAAPKP